MTQKVRIRKINSDGTAQVLHIRQSACSGDCHQCAGCGAAQETLLLTAYNPIGAREGDVVIIESKSGPVLAAAAVLYMLPVLLFFVGYFVGAQLWNAGALMGGAAFCVGIAGCVVYDRCITKKQKTVYTITGYAHT